MKKITYASLFVVALIATSALLFEPTAVSQKASLHDNLRAAAESTNSPEEQAVPLITEPQSEPTNDPTSGQQQSNPTENRAIASEEKLISLGLNLSLYDDAEILALRKLISNIDIYDDEIPMMFEAFLGLSFVNILYPEYEEDIHLVDQLNPRGIDIHNPDIEYWENLSLDGNVVATQALAHFFHVMQRFPKAEKLYQKLLVNVTDKTLPLQQLVNCTGQFDDKRSAAYLWYAEENGIQLPEGSTNPEYLAFKEKYRKEDIEAEIQEIKQTIEGLEVNYANAKLTDLNDVYQRLAIPQ